MKKKRTFKHMLEIGGGPAINASLLNYKYGTKSIIIDFANSKYYCFFVYIQFFPNLKMSFENYRNLLKKTW